MKSLLSDAESHMPGIPFDTVYTTVDGFLARQLTNNDPRDYTLTWKISRDLTGEIIIPLPLYATNDITDLRTMLAGYEHAGIFLDVLADQGHRILRIADLNFLMTILLVTAAKYRRLLQSAGEKTDYYFKARVLNAWRVCPFIDVEDSLDQFRVHGIPMLMDGITTIPVGQSPESFAHISEMDTSDERLREYVVSNLQAYTMFTFLSLAFGIRTFMDKPAGGRGKAGIYFDFIDAGNRARTVQVNRNERMRRHTT